MKKLIFIVIITCCFNVACVASHKEPQRIGLVNPWIECKEDLKCAEEKAGFTFPIELSNINIRAMEGMIEIKHLLGGKDVTIRKSLKNDKGDISGDYNKYPINKELSINYKKFKVRGDDDTDKIYVVTFSSKTAKYAIMCDKGINLDEIWDIYEVVKKADNL